jgi:alanine-glyoxylate transaminase/serine-glyoxylate transaminase/serine-pyruvate transaminase
VTLRPRGRQFFHNPGPTNIPDKVLRAMDRAVLDFLSEEFMEIHRECHAGLKDVLKTRQHLFMYAASGHGAWEAATVNVFSPGDKVLMLESGYFSESWSAMTTKLGLVIETIPSDWRQGVDMGALAVRLEADRAHEIKGLLVVHNETATGLAHPIAEVRKALDAAGHPALLLADTISSLACFDFRMDDWGVDVAVGGSQKGLMLPTGMSITGVSTKALEAAKVSKTPRQYWDWREMGAREPQRFIGTTPVHHFFGLQASLKLLQEEGLDAVFARHARFARATRAAVRHWGGLNDTSDPRNGAAPASGGRGPNLTAAGNGPELYCRDPRRYSSSLTAVLLPEGHDGDKMRRHALEKYNLSLGGGLGPLGGRVIRIGHMGDLNEPMMLGALATTELAFKACGVPHRPGGVDAALEALAAS